MRFTKLLIVGSKDNRNAINRSLQCIVNSHSKSTSDVRHISITIDRRKNSDNINYQAIGRFQVICIRIRIANKTTIEQFGYFGNVRSVNFVRYENQFNTGMKFKITNQQFFIFSPGTTRNNNLFATFYKLLYQWKLLCLSI